MLCPSAAAAARNFCHPMCIHRRTQGHSGNLFDEVSGRFVQAARHQCLPIACLSAIPRAQTLPKVTEFADQQAPSRRADGGHADTAGVESQARLAKMPPQCGGVREG